MTVFTKTVFALGKLIQAGLVDLLQNLLDDVLIEQARGALESGAPVTLAHAINNRMACGMIVSSSLGANSE